MIMRLEVVSLLQAPKFRGPSKSLALAQAVRDNRGKLPVDIPDKLCVPIDANATYFINEIGVLCRTYIPIRHIVKWKYVTEADKDNIVHRLLDNFIFDPTREAVNVYLNHKMPNALNEFRGKLHRHYEDNKYKDGIQVARVKKHAQVENLDDWVFLCDMWETPKFKATSEANVENRGKMKYNHKTGSRSHVRVMTDHQAEDEDHEEEFNQIDLFRVTHTNDKGNWINDAAKEDYSKMCDLLVAPEVEVDGVVQPRLTEDEIIERVRGYRSGYIKGLGAGPAHHRVSSHSRGGRSRVVEDPRVDQLVLENKELTSKYNEMKDNYLELRRDLLEMRNNFSTFTQTPPS